jgi:hypothetical protein
MTAPYAGSIRDLYGIPVQEAPYLPYDEMVVAQSAILVGEIKHFMWRLRVQAENEAVRKVARAQIMAAYERILGEPHPQQ